MKYNIPVYEYDTLSIHSPTKGHLTCFQFGENMNKANIYNFVQFFMDLKSVN